MVPKRKEGRNLGSLTFQWWKWDVRVMAVGIVRLVIL